MKHQGLATSSALKVSPFWREEYPDRVEVLGWVALLLLLLLSGCSQEPTQPELPVDTPVSVTADLQVSMLPFTSLTEGIATRADVDKTTEEKDIKSAYVVQFDGTSAASTAVWVSADVSPLLKVGSPVNVNFTLVQGVKSCVYVVVNPQSIPTVDMTLQAFETVVYTASSTLPSTGLPMAAKQIVLLGKTFGVFQLRSPLAKLTFTTNLGTLTLKGIPSAYSLVPVTAGDAAVRPSGVTYTNTLAMTSGTAYYVPANLSGRVALSDKILRCSTFAPANSMYVTVSANNTTYNYYLGDGREKDFNVVGNYAYNVGVTITGINAFDMRIGTPPAVTALDTEGTANCYIATAADTWYSFSGTVMGNGATTPLPADLNSESVASAITPSSLSPVSADVLWETWNTTSTPTKGSVVGAVGISNGRILFCTGSSEGNAVIAARDAQNNIVWSWHIWRTNTTPATQPLAAITDLAAAGELVIMDRNLGALSAAAQDDLSTGLHYQWGRKDPFPASAGLTSPNNVVMATQPSGIPSTGSGGSIVNAIANPTKFYTGSDWTSRNDNLWGTPLTYISGKYTTNKGSKTIYDPCPPGWRMPPGYTFENASLSNGGTFNVGFSFGSGFLSSGSSWFPASGERYYDGWMGDVGSQGHYWTAAPHESYPMNGSSLWLFSEMVSSGNRGRRDYGLSCRCVKE